MHHQLVRALALAIVALGLSASVQAPASAVIDRDCGDFPSQAAAQSFFLNAGAGDPHRLDDDGDGASFERDPRRRASAAETGMHTEVELDPGQLEGQPARLGLALRGQADGHVRVTVDAAHDVQLRLPVPDEDEEAHPLSLRPACRTPARRA